VRQKVGALTARFPLYRWKLDGARHRERTALSPDAVVEA
jgi:hypothetical protein